MKRILSIFIAFALMCSFSSFVTAENENHDDAVEFVKAFALMPICDYKDLEKEVKRDEFARILCAVKKWEASNEKTAEFVDISESEWSGYIYKCAEHGIIKGVNKYLFEPERPIYRDEAVKLFLDMLGYEINASMLGGYPNGYLSIAEGFGVLKNIPAENKAMTRKDVAQLIYNCSDVSVPDIEIKGDEIIYDAEKEKTMMTEFLGIDRIKGVLEDNGITTLEGEKSVGREKTVIAGKEYLVREGYDITEFIGRNVIAYYTVSKNNDFKDETVLYVKIDSRKEKESITFELKDFIGLKGSVITYYENGKEKDFELSSTPNIVINGVAQKSYSESCFDFDYGTVTYLPGQGEYDDTLIVEGYVSWYLKGIDKEEGLLYASDESKAIEDSRVIKIDEDEIGKSVFIYNQYGEVTDLKEIYNYTVIDISKNGDVIKISIPPVSALSETVKGISEDDYGRKVITFGEKDYYIAKSFEKSDLVANLKLKNEYLIFTNSKGQICYIDYNRKPDNLFVGYAIKTVEDDETEGVIIKALTDEDIVTVLKTEDKVLFSGKDGKDLRVENAKLVNLMSDYTGIFNYRISADNKIKEIYLPMDMYEKREKGRLGCIYDSSKTNGFYYETGRNIIDGKIAFNQNISAFAYYADKDSDEMYQYRTFKELQKGSSSKSVLKAYNYDPESLYAEHMTYSSENTKYSIPVIYEGTLVLVKDFEMILDDKDEVGYELDCYNINSAKDQNLFMDEGLFNKMTSTTGSEGKKKEYTVEKGDILLCKIKDNEIVVGGILYRSSLKNVYDPENGRKGNILENYEKYGSSPSIVLTPILPGGGTATGYTTRGRTVFGSIYSLDSKGAVIYTTHDLSVKGKTFNRASDYNEVLFPPAGTNFITIDYSGDKISAKVGTLSDIKTYKEVGEKCSRVITVSSYGLLNRFILIND